MILVDANILLRMCNHHDPMYGNTTDLVFAHRRIETLVIVPQSLFEFWAVATRDPAQNGIGMDVDNAGTRNHTPDDLQREAFFSLSDYNH